MKKYCLPTGWYFATCRGLQRDGDLLQFVWTVDRGEDTWQNVIQQTTVFDLKAIDQIRRVFSAINVVLPEDFTQPVIEALVYGVRAQLSVTQLAEDNGYSVIKRNIIIEAKPATVPAEIDVFAERNDSHILRGSQFGAAKLPIRPQKI
jgi:hypothetical protein